MQQYSSHKWGEQHTLAINLSQLGINATRLGMQEQELGGGLGSHRPAKNRRPEKTRHYTSKPTFLMLKGSTLTKGGPTGQNTRSKRIKIQSNGDLHCINSYR